MTDLFNTGVRPAIDAYLLAKSKQERNYGDYWSASSAGYCMRLNIMRRLGVPKVPELEDNATQTRIFEAGHIFHEWLQRITKDAGLSIASEVELQDEDLMIRGHFDDLILIKELEDQDPDNRFYREHLILYDYKTAHSASFNYKKQRTEIGHYHKMQLGTYMYMLRKQVLDLRAEEKKLMFGKEPSEDVNALESLGWRIGSLPSKELVEEARILSISKDDLRMHEEQLLWTPELEKDVYSYWSTLNGYWKARTLPKCTCLDHDGGFMGRKSAKGKFYNDFFYEDEPCSLKWYAKWKESNDPQRKG
jgi:hypothetical protein